MYCCGQTAQFARADADDMSEYQKTLRSVGQNAHVHDHGFHLATRSLSTCALNVTTTTRTRTTTTTTSSSTSSSSGSSPSSMNVEL
jgi:hypothetical protein